MGMYIVFEVLGIYCYFFLGHLELHAWQNKSRELKIGALRNPHRANKKSRELNKQAPGCAGAVTLTQLETPQGATGEAPITDHHGF